MPSEKHKQFVGMEKTEWLQWGYKKEHAQEFRSDYQEIAPREAVKKNKKSVLFYITQDISYRKVRNAQVSVITDFFIHQVSKSYFNCYFSAVTFLTNSLSLNA